MDFRHISLDRVQFDAPSKPGGRRITVRYGSEKRLVFQTPLYTVRVLQHRFLPGGLTLHMARHDEMPPAFTLFLQSMENRLGETLGVEIANRDRFSSGHPMEYVTVNDDTIMFDVDDGIMSETTLQVGSTCRVALIVAVTGGWATWGDTGSIVKHGLSIEANQLKLYDTFDAPAPKTFINGVPVFLDD